MSRSSQDAHGVLRDSFDDNSKSLRVDVGNASIQIDSISDSIALGDVAGNKVTTSVIGPSRGLDVNILSGGVSVQGLSTDFKISVITVTDTPIKVTTIPLTGRNSLCIRNWGQNTVFFGHENTVTTASGYPKYSKEEMSLDIKELDLWAVCAAGQSTELRILEIS
jgi:hypothetical protein